MVPLTKQILVETIAETTPDLLLIPALSSQLEEFKYLESLLDLFISHTNVLDYFELGSIMARPQKGTFDPFKYLKCFDRFTLLTYIFLLILITLLISLTRSDKNKISEYFWCLSTLLFSKSVQNLVKKLNKKQNYFFSQWIVTSVVINICFSSFILDFMIKDPNVYINSFEDILEVDNLKLLVSKESTLNKYLEDEEPSSDLATLIKERIEVFNVEEMHSKEFRAKVTRDLELGTHGLVFNKVTLIVYIMVLDELAKSDKLINQLHLSNEGGGDVPIFLPINKKSPRSVQIQLNSM